MQNTYNFTPAELVKLLKSKPVESKHTQVDKELEMERHLLYIGKNPHECGHKK